MIYITVAAYITATVFHHAVIRAAPVIFLDVAIEDAARWCDGRRGRWHDGRGDLQGAAIGAGADDLHARRDRCRS